MLMRQILVAHSTSRRLANHSTFPLTSSPESRHFHLSHSESPGHDAHLCFTRHLRERLSYVITRNVLFGNVKMERHPTEKQREGGAVRPRHTRPPQRHLMNKRPQITGPYLVAPSPPPPDSPRNPKRPNISPSAAPLASGPAVHQLNTRSTQQQVNPDLLLLLLLHLLLLLLPSC
ncbi:hypothetical protein E2C01_025960 [Portunus trituberculatus]|uniref:Uncharacterized protein n=1 Tax=Portunus trituberculatus TaxID=210409 RepID=A0A5B7EGV3_PORTR|nr:hypothetical protein [Portunus trituberculatus]